MIATRVGRPTSLSLGAYTDTLLVGSPPAEDDGDGPEQQPQIAGDAPVGDVQVVELQHLLERDRRPSEDLPETRDAGRQIDAPAPPADDVLIGVDRHRP